MTRAEQKRFVRELIDGIHGDVNAAIDNEDIPEAWDGIELREYIYEKALRARANHHLTGKRGREYRNVLTINPNL